jgi:hypothetical protein
MLMAGMKEETKCNGFQFGAQARNVQILQLKFNSNMQARLNKNKNVHSNSDFPPLSAYTNMQPY